MVSWSGSSGLRGAAEEKSYLIKSSFSCNSTPPLCQDLFLVVLDADLNVRFGSEADVRVSSRDRRKTGSFHSQTVAF